MTQLECPLCCAENFPDEASLKDHLLNLSENIVCPICEVQFKTIRCLGLHLGGECSRLSSETAESVAVEQVDSDIISFDTTVFQDKSQGEAEEEIKGELTATVVVIPDDDDRPQVSTSHDYGNEGCDTKNEGDAKTLENVTSVTELDGSAVELTNLYSCSMCDITFTSVEGHLKEYHKDEQVFIDAADMQEYRLVEKSEDPLAADSEKMDTSEAPPSSTSEYYNNISEEILSDGSTGLIWAQDDFKTIMLGNWTTGDESMNGSGQQGNGWSGGNRLLNSQRGYVLMPRVETSEGGRWVETRDGFFYAPTEARAAEIKLRETADLESALYPFQADWPPEVSHLPVATFVLPTLGPDYYPGYLVEKRPYVYRDHKVRVVLVKGGDGGVPGLEDVPFLEEPPPGVMWPPLLEPVTGGDAPPDLAGSFAVLWPCKLCSQLDLDPRRDHNCLTTTNDCGTERGCAEEEVKMVAAKGKTVCGICSATVQSPVHLKKHMAMHIRNDLVHCDFCNSMVPKSTFDRHINAHNKNGHLSLVCRMCNRPFKGEEELKQHMPQCHIQENPEELQLRCHACKLDFPDVPQLRSHLESKHGIQIRQHLCLYCPKSFTRLIDKVTHEGMHTRNRPHECSDCCRCFRLKSSLLQHTRIHTGEKPFSCKVCGKAFRTRFLVQMHSAIHSTDNHIRCTECPKVFKCKERAKMHELMHRRPYKCEECGRTFHSLTFMRKHTDNHRNGKLVYTCSFCPQMFARAAYLEAHLEAEHGLDSATSISISCQKTFEQMAEADKQSKAAAAAMAALS